MPLFEVSANGLVPFRQLTPGPELYEQEIEDLVWSDLEAFLGEALFPIARQARLPGGGKPDVLALDVSGRVVVIEVKRDVDRSQLAQCLEYAGWARTTSLDELASLYHEGAEAFWSAWQDFTETATPVVVNRSPRVVLIARQFEGRTQSALEFLRENGLPVMLIPVSVYEDSQGRRFVDVEADHQPLLPEPAVASDVARPGPVAVLYGGRRATVADLLANGLVLVGEALEFVRPRLGETYRAEVLADGSIRTEDGETWPSPSRAAMSAANVESYDGWHAWRVPRLGGVKLDQMRRSLLANEDDGKELPGDDAVSVHAEEQA